jgi:drug/metabolite transporter (DMT)-like permease
MIYLVFSVICSVTVGVLLKLAKRYHINITQAVAWNYLFAIVLSLVCFKPSLTNASLNHLLPAHYILGLLLPSLFLVLGMSVRKAGLARTDIAQRLSLFISISAAYFLFRENFDRYKEVAVVFGFLAIIFTMYRKSDRMTSRKSWLYLLLVFLGFGAVDILFKLVSQATEVPYTTSLFIIYSIAFLISTLYVAYLVFQKRTKLQLVNFFCGCILGIFNFGNILFYLEAHRSMSNNPSTVFAAMNMGVIVAGSLIGIFIFRERLSNWNYVGLALALASIVLITLSKLYAV